MDLVKRVAMAVAFGASGLVAAPGVASAGVEPTHHGAYMVEGYYPTYQACNERALVLNINPWDDWADASCHSEPDRVALIAKHV